MAMTKREKEVQQTNLKSEERLIRELKQVYKQASKDCQEKIDQLASRTDMQNLQSIIYQQQYQRAMESQVDGILDTLQSNEFVSIEDYLGESYNNGYLGAMYDLQGQGIPIISPIDQSQVVKALQTDSKLSTSMYTRLGEDIGALKNSIRAEMSRGIANGSTWLEIADRIANGMNSPFNTAMNNSIRIARTEGHRIQQEAQFDALEEAKDSGANVVKQWDATLDARTRPEHQKLDGQLREIDEEFQIDGYHALMPGGFGAPEMDINCRCCATQRAKWALDEDELETLKRRADYYGLDKTEDFEDFKEKYLDAAEVSEQADDFILKCKDAGIEYNEVKMRETPLSEEKIIATLGGGDQTDGSCASLALAYIGQKGGADVLDFRGGASLEMFSLVSNLSSILSLPGAKTKTVTRRSDTSVGRQLLRGVETGKEYMMVVGRHASIVRRTNDGTLQYLELQSGKENGNGWVDFGESVNYTLRERFGCERLNEDVQGYISEVDSLKDSKDLQRVLGYINTVPDTQKKGPKGNEK